MKKSAIFLGCVLLVLLASDAGAATPKKKIHTHSAQSLEVTKGDRDELETVVGKHCPKSNIKFLKCESDGDFLPYQHPADGDGPWWQGSYDAGE